MKKNGFTLIELLAVIALLGVLVVIAVPTYNVLSTKTKNKLYDEKKEAIETAAALYAKDREEELKGGDIEAGHEDQTATGNVNEGLVDETVGESLDSTKRYVTNVKVWYLLMGNYLDNEGECSDTPQTEVNTEMTVGNNQKIQVNNGKGRKEVCNPKDKKSMRNVQVNLTRKVLSNGKVTYKATLQE